MRILVTGSRNWTDEQRVMDALYCEWMALGEPEHAVLVHGDCPTGADKIAVDMVRKARVFTFEAHPADWGQHGKAAGPIRNQEMVDLGADVCIAFPLPDSRGTRDCMRRAAKAGIRVENWADR